MKKTTLQLSEYITNFHSFFPLLTNDISPWDLIHSLDEILEKVVSTLVVEDFDLKDGALINKQATMEKCVTIKGRVIIGKDCLIRSGAYLRGPIFLGTGVTIGANCEIKQSIIFKDSNAAHLNYVGNSIIGENVNLEAGVILANHFNERNDKNITVKHRGRLIKTNVTKFGSLIGDRCKVGANAVLNPGTLLSPESVVDRLTHINQLNGN